MRRESPGVGGLCSNASGYSFNQMFDGGSGVAASAEARLVAHELGHNFGSPHTHCYSNAPLPRPDACNGVEVPGCYLGAASCPAAGNYQGIATSGTIMSYCHNLGGCSTQTVFHPRTIEEFFAPNVADAAAAPSQCLYPSITPSQRTDHRGHGDHDPGSRDSPGSPPSRSVAWRRLRSWWSTTPRSPRSPGRMPREW